MLLNPTRWVFKCLARSMRCWCVPYVSFLLCAFAGYDTERWTGGCQDNQERLQERWRRGGGSDILWHLKCTSVSHSHSPSMCQCVSLVLHKKGRASLFLQLFLILRIDEGGRSKRRSAAGNMQPPFLSPCSFSHSFHSVFSPCVTSSFPQWVFASPSTFSLPLVLSFSSPPLFCTPPPNPLLLCLWWQRCVLLCEKRLAKYDAGERLHAGHCDCQLRG